MAKVVYTPELGPFAVTSSCKNRHMEQHTFDEFQDAWQQAVMYKLDHQYTCPERNIYTIIMSKAGDIIWPVTAMK